MKLIVSIILIAFAPLASAASDPDADCAAWTSRMLQPTSDACDDLCPQALHFDKFNYRAGLKAAFASPRGLSALISYTGRSSIMGAGADAQACSLQALLAHWGDESFSAVARKHDLKTRERLVGLLDYAGVPEFQTRFPRSYALATHVE